MKINIDDQCMQVFKELKFNNDKTRYLVYKILNQKIVFERLGAKEQSWQKFVDSLPDKEPRFCVFDLQFTNKDKMAISKLFFMYWLPDGTPIKLKMLYASGKEAFKTYLDLGGKEIILNDKEEMDEASLIKEFDK